MAKLHLFYVEDDEIDIISWQRFFSRCDDDITFDIFTSVDSAISQFDPNKYDIALLDWNLPDGSGLEVAQHIREVSSAFPIIFLSALFSQQCLMEATPYNPLGCVQKEGTKESMLQVSRLFERVT